MISPERGRALLFLQSWFAARSRGESLLQEVAEVMTRGYLRRSDTLFLAALARFCNAGDSSLGDSDARTNANEGRREVWLFVKAMLGLSEEETDQFLQESER